MTCPKCGAPRDPRACPKCGLAADKMDAFAVQQDAAATESLRAAWDAVVEGWDDDGRHTAFMRIVVDENAFAWAATRYREKKPDPRAETMLGKIRKAAEARLATTASVKPPAKSVFGSVKVLIGGAIIMILALMFMLSYMSGKQNRVDTRTLAPPPAAQGSQVR